MFTRGGLQQQRVVSAQGTRDVQPQQLLHADSLPAGQPKPMFACATVPATVHALAWAPHISGHCSPIIMNGFAEIMPSPSLGSGCRTLWHPPSLALIFRAKLLVYCRCFLGSRGRSAATQQAREQQQLCKTRSKAESESAVQPDLQACGARVTRAAESGMHKPVLIPRQDAEAPVQLEG